MQLLFTFFYISQRRNLNWLGGEIGKAKKCMKNQIRKFASPVIWDFTLSVWYYIKVNVYASKDMFILKAKKFSLLLKSTFLLCLSGFNDMSSLVSRARMKWWELHRPRLRFICDPNEFHSWVMICRVDLSGETLKCRNRYNQPGRKTRKRRRPTETEWEN